MAFGAGHNGVFKIDDAGGGSLQDISAYVTNVQLVTAQGTYDVTTLGVATKAFISGLGEWSLSVTGHFDATVDGYLSGVDSASRSIDLFPAGSPVGSTKPEYTGEVLKTNYQTTDPVDGVVGFSLSLQGTGTLTRAVA